MIRIIKALNMSFIVCNHHLDWTSNEKRKKIVEPSLIERKCALNYWRHCQKVVCVVTRCLARFLRDSCCHGLSRCCYWHFLSFIFLLCSSTTAARRKKYIAEYINDVFSYILPAYLHKSSYYSLFILSFSLSFSLAWALTRFVVDDIAFAGFLLPEDLKLWDSFNSY